MKDKETIIRDLEDEILLREECIRNMQSEVAAMKVTVDGLRNPVAFPPIQSQRKDKPNKLSDYPGYPADGDLIDKLRYLEDLKLKFWKAKTMEDLILEIEDEKRSYKSTNNFRQRLSGLVNSGQLINMKYNDSLKYCFYSTRREWIQPIQIGLTSTYEVIKEHLPEKSEVENLSEDQLKPERISWRGIK